MELQPGDVSLMFRHIRHHQVHRFRVFLFRGHGQDGGGVGQGGIEPVEAGHDGLQGGPFLTHGLRALGILPELRLLELAQDFRQTFLFLCVVKDTP